MVISAINHSYWRLLFGWWFGTFWTCFPSIGNNYISLLVFINFLRGWSHQPEYSIATPKKIETCFHNGRSMMFPPYLPCFNFSIYVGVLEMMALAWVYAMCRIWTKFWENHMVYTITLCSYVRSWMWNFDGSMPFFNKPILIDVYTVEIRRER